MLAGLTLACLVIFMAYIFLVFIILARPPVLWCGASMAGIKYKSIQFGKTFRNRVQANSRIPVGDL
jgi:hypothetical protein